MGLVKTRRLAAMQKQQRAKAGMKPPKPKARHEFDVRRLYANMTKMIARFRLTSAR